MFNFSMSPTTNDIPAAPHGVKITTLDNGLTIIVREDRSARSYQLLRVRPCVNFQP